MCPDTGVLTENGEKTDAEYLYGSGPEHFYGRKPEEYYAGELQAIREEITSLRSEFSRFLQRANQRHLEGMLTEMKNNFLKPMIDYLCEDANEKLKNGMVSDCKMKELCEATFRDLLHETAELVGKDKVETETMNLYRNRFNELKEKAGSEKCSKCFSEASALFERQVKLLRSLQIYDGLEDGSQKADISDIQPEELVPEICEPVANRHRLLMLKALSGENKTFSELSKLTGLRGGNLLFHLQKLLDSGMVLQRSERGDYIITRKGYATLQGLSKIYSDVKNEA